MSTNSFESAMSIEQIALNMKNEIIFLRWVGAWIDFGVIFLFMLVSGLTVFGIPTMRAYAVVNICFCILYYSVLEGFLGWTVGKLVMKIRVVNSSGNPPGVWKASIRTLTRMLEVNPIILGGLPAGLIATQSKSKQRLGDKITKTYVIPSRHLSTQ